jgi:hypothetical protein
VSAILDISGGVYTGIEAVTEAHEEDAETRSNRVGGSITKAVEICVNLGGDLGKVSTGSNI